MLTKPLYRIALLFNANKSYDRQILQGIGEFFVKHSYHYQPFILDDFCYYTEFIKSLNVDGIIADFDDMDTYEILSKFQDIPIVAVGSSYNITQHYPKHIPYIATDNYKLIKEAFLHLKSKGISNFAYYGMTAPKDGRHWSIERENAFVSIMNEYNYSDNYILRTEKVNAKNYLNIEQDISKWIISLPLHTGIIAVTDARARHLLQACEIHNIPVPEQLAIIGIDNEELIQYLSSTPLSSVMQGTKKMGYLSAKLLVKQLNKQPINKFIYSIPPEKIIARTSTDYRSISDPYIIQAMHYIRHNAYNGICVEQVLDYLKISRTNLEKRFKKELNKTIHQIIFEEKLNKALILLKTTTYPINEIATICGYPSIQYFYTIFKKHLSITPNEYRHKYKEN